MALSTSLINLVFAPRLRAIEYARRNPMLVQYNQLDYLFAQAPSCEYLTRHGIHTKSTYRDFSLQVPIVDYDALSPEIERVRRGERGILWHKPTRWYAKSSGTTTDRSKFIPITEDSLQRCHLKAGKDLIAIFCANHPESKALTGKSLTLGGSHAIDREGSSALSGDLSAILIENTPSWFRNRRLPSLKTALTADFEQKLELICAETITENITNFAGVPSWNLVLMNKILDYTGKSNIHEVWPEMSLFVHGGVAFGPYREQYERIFPSSTMHYLETYNASEGFFALQDDPRDSSMLLMVDYGIFYEFMPVKQINNPRQTVPLEGVELGVNYAMIISTNGGLWRYMIGDTVEFTSLNPPKIKITGRTRQFINAFGEEIIVDNAEQALSVACRATGAQIREYTAAPIYMEGKSKGGHEWFIEFSTAPDSTERFAEVLDATLQAVNSDYAAKRYHDTTLHAPRVVIASDGAFYRWMQTRGKVGGQNKVPRLSNDRNYIDALKEA